jgi:hypothetical protein
MTNPFQTYWAMNNYGGSHLSSPTNQKYRDNYHGDFYLKTVNNARFFGIFPQARCVTPTVQ